MNHIKELNEHIRENGLDGLLPQNLSDNILSKMLTEIESYKNGSIYIPSSTLLTAILSIKSGKIIKNGINRSEIDFNPDSDLMDNFISYALCVELECIIRNTSVYVPDDSLSTLKNIFDKNRKVQISGLE